MENEEIKEKIVEALEPEELQELRKDLFAKKDELEEINDWEMEENEVDDWLDEVYEEVDLAGTKYSFSSVLKATDDYRYDNFRDDIESEKRDEKEEDLKDEVEDLEEQIDNYE